MFYNVIQVWNIDCIVNNYIQKIMLFNHFLEDKYKYLSKENQDVLINEIDKIYLEVEKILNMCIKEIEINIKW